MIRTLFLLSTAFFMAPLATAVAPRFQAIAFDGFPIFDPRPVARQAEAYWPGRGEAFMAAWRTRQFDYQWLRALAGQYADFNRATADALDFAARQTQTPMTPEQRTRLLELHATLPVWPEVPETLRALRKSGLRLVLLSNMTEATLTAGLKRAGLEGEFEAVLSTDTLRTYKPDPKAYQMAADRLGLDKADILFAAHAGWDAAGAKWFGYPVFWVNRLGAPPEALGPAPDGMGPDLRALARFVGVQAPAPPQPEPPR